jgi:hypothetical protein
VPKCGAMIEYLYYWEKAVSIGGVLAGWIPRHKDLCDVEFYFLCPECGKILFDREKPQESS